MNDKTAVTLYQGQYLSLKRTGHWEYAARHHPLAVVLIAWTPAGELLLVEQYRPPVGGPVIELPAGLVGDLVEQANEPALQAAARELEEETGYRAGRLEALMTCPTSPGMSNEHALFVRATELERTGPGGGDDTEDITVHPVAAKNLEPWLEACRRDGRPIDPKIYAAMYLSGLSRQP